MRLKGLTCIVFSYNRRDVIEACLSAGRWAEELIVVDKGSFDGALEIAHRVADRVVKVPWSPTVEGTRGEAMAHASNDWVLCLDDDECPNRAAMEFFREYLSASSPGMPCTNTPLHPWAPRRACPLSNDYGQLIV